MRVERGDCSNEKKRKKFKTETNIDMHSNNKFEQCYEFERGKN